MAGRSNKSALRALAAPLRTAAARACSDMGRARKFESTAAMLFAGHWWSHILAATP